MNLTAGERSSDSCRRYSWEAFVSFLDGKPREKERRETRDEILPAFILSRRALSPQATSLSVSAPSPNPLLSHPFSITTLSRRVWPTDYCSLLWNAFVCWFDRIPRYPPRGYSPSFPPIARCYLIELDESPAFLFRREREKGPRS